MDCTSNEAKGDSSGVCKKYTRNELFNFARSMNDELPQFVEDIKKFENYEWNETSIGDKFEDAVVPTPYKPIRTLSNFCRRNSELEREYTSLQSDSRMPNDLSSSRNNKFRPISRMASNPSISYNSRNNQQALGLEARDKVTLQIRAKYARLIESMERSAIKHVNSGADKSRRDAASSTYSSRAPLRGSISHDQSFQSAERPTQLFGPLRKESPTIRQQLKAVRGQPDYYQDEPQSLPYFGISSNDFVASRDQTSEGFDHSLPSIRKLSLARDGKADEAMHNNEEDDFDINNLLSITVLSDIKAYRNDLQTIGRQQSMENSSNQRNQDMMKPPRLITRSRTATDFTYNGRLGYEPTMQQRPKSGYNANMQHQNSSIKQDSLYNNSQGRRLLIHRPSSFDSQEMARSNHVNSNIQESSVTKKVDESALQIIETFKAQVKARAQSNESTGSTTQQSESPEKGTEKKISNPVPILHEKLDSSESATTSFNAKKPSLFIEDEVNKVDFKDNLSTKNVEGSPVVKQEVEAIARDAINKKKFSLRSDSLGSEDVPEKESDQKTDTEFDMKEEVKSTSFSGKNADHLNSRPSNIPRLISLQQSRHLILDALRDTEKSATPAVSRPAGILSSKSIITTIRSTDKPSAPGAKVAKGIVSRYKLLRGKSLADEVSETFK